MLSDCPDFSPESKIRSNKIKKRICIIPNLNVLTLREWFKIKYKLIDSIRVITKNLGNTIVSVTNGTAIKLVKVESKSNDLYNRVMLFDLMTYLPRSC